MAKSYADKAVADIVARQTKGIRPDDKITLERLRGLLVATAENDPESMTLHKSDRIGVLHVDEHDRDSVTKSKLSRKDRNNPPLAAARRDAREDLIALRLADPLTALGGAERLGPFIDDDRPVFFDFWRIAKRFEVTEQGSGMPAFVLSSARRPFFSSVRYATKALESAR